MYIPQDIVNLIIDQMVLVTTVTGGSAKFTRWRYLEFILEF